MTKQEIQELKASLSIREVIGRYTKLNRVGRRWMGLCPFHGDRHPSLSVNEEKGSFVCYACGERGDVFAFVSKIENVGFVEAANKLSIDSGQLAIEGKDNKEARLLPERLVIKEKKENSDAEQLPVVNSQLSIENEAFLALLLPAGSGCSELTPTWLDFGVGQSPCLVPERWKAMRNRLVFPVRDEEGRLAGFAARGCRTKIGINRNMSIRKRAGCIGRANCCTGCMRHGRRSAGRGASFWWKDIRMCWRCMRRGSGIRWRCAGRRFVRGTLLC